MFDAVVGGFGIATFFVQAFGLSQLLPGKRKDLCAITEKARDELSAAFEILNQFHSSVDDDLLSPLVLRYKRLHGRVRAAEREAMAELDLGISARSRPTKAQRRRAQETLVLCHKLYVQIRAASEDARFAKFLKGKNWTPEGNPILLVQPPAVASKPASCLMRYKPSKNSAGPLYPPGRAGSHASIVSNPFKDPPGAVPFDPAVPQSPSSPQ